MIRIKSETLGHLKLVPKRVSWSKLIIFCHCFILWKYVNIIFFYRLIAEDKVEILGGNDKVEFNDPAILDVKYVKRRYDMDELIRIRKLPLSNKRPSFLDTAYDRYFTHNSALVFFTNFS